MIGYVCIGTNDLAASARFYDALLDTIGAQRVWDTEKMIAWGVGGKPTLILIKPADGKPATVGNGTMVALSAKSKAEVDTVYKQALSLGATCEGPAGPRGDNFYAGYFRDPAGNKLCSFIMG